MLKNSPDTSDIPEKIAKRNIFSKKNFSELKKYFQKLINNFWEITDEEILFLNQNKENFSEKFIISNFRKILNKRANNWETWIIFLFEEMKKNKKLLDFFYDDFVFAKKILETKSRIFDVVRIF